jgi:chromosome transmission fidelity protein 8
MPSVPLFPPQKTGSSSLQNTFSPLPPLLQTPSGLAILELQGTINIPSWSTAATDKDGAIVYDDDDSLDKDTPDGKTIETELGRLIFPDYVDGMDADNNKWMKRAYMFIGRYQRMTGEVKKLAKPLAVIQRRQTSENGKGKGEEEKGEEEGDELEIVEIIKYKIIFASRPEPVGME